MKTRIHIRNLGLIIGLVCFGGCAMNPATGKKQVGLMSEDRETAIAKKCDSEIIAYFGSYHDPLLQKFVKEKGQEMVKVSGNSDLKYEFRVVDSPVINAFATPGGYVYFTRGMMASLNSEAEFAGVLGHEIGHITAKHPVTQQKNSMLNQFASVSGVVLVPELSNFVQPQSSGMQLTLVNFGKDAERQSDKLGVEYSTRVGYDATSMAGFFTTLQRQEQVVDGKKIQEFLSTHPSPQERSVEVTHLAGEWRNKLKLTNPKIERDSYLKRIDGLILGEDPKQGFVEDNIFYHPMMKFQAMVPEGWILQNTPMQIQMVPDNGEAMFTISLLGKIPLEEAPHKVVKLYGLTPIESAEENSNGFNSMWMTADQQQKNGTVRILCSLFQYKGNTYSLMGMSELSRFTTYQPLFVSAINSFKELTDADKLNRTPEVIRIKTVPEPMTLHAAFRNFNMSANRFEELAILNGMELSDELRQGTLIKVVEQQSSETTARNSVH